MNGSLSKGVTPSSAKAFAFFAASLLGACTAAVAPQDESEPAAIASAATPVPAGAVRGEIVRYVFDMQDGQSEQHLYLRTSPNEPERHLVLPAGRDFEAGTLVDVWGDETEDGIRVQRIDPVVTQTESAGQALVTDTPLRPRRFALVLVDLGQGVKMTKADAEKRMFGTASGDKSLRQYFIEASYGRQDIGGEVIGPIQGTMAGCNFQALANSLRAKVPTGFDHYLWFFGNRVASCPFLGVAVTGTPARPYKDTWYNNSLGCVVLVQEPVHNFGTLHSSAMRCRNGMPFADQPQGTCVHSEYGDPYDPMGGGCRHMNGYQKAFQGWFGGCNVVDVNASNTFTLLPMASPCDGPQVLQIKMPKARPFAHSGGGGGAGTTDITHYYVEYRAPIGFDTGLPQMVQVRVSGDIRQRTQRGFNTWILDMNPATATPDGLGVGGTYTDPAGGIKITVMSMDGKSAVVKVENPAGTGAATCLDGKPLPSPAPGPETCSASVATPMGSAPAFPTSDGGTTTPPTMPGSDAGTGTGTGGSNGGSTGTGGSSGGGSTGTGGSAGSGGPLVPVAHDAGTTSGFGGATGTSEPSNNNGGRNGNGAGGESGGSPVSSGGKASGGCTMAPGAQPGGMGLALAGLAGLLLRRRRRQ